MQGASLFSLLSWFVLSWAAVTTAVTFRLEAEDLPGAHVVSARSAASNFKTVYVTNVLERLSFPVCLYRPVSANLTVTYSNDGGSDDVRVRISDDSASAQNLTFSSSVDYGNGAKWNVFKSAFFSGITLQRGYLRLSLVFELLDEYGIEIDFVDVSVDDAFITDDVFRCKLMLGSEPTFLTNATAGVVSEGYVEQRSYVTPCPEEDNVHLAVYHDNVTQYTLTASNPLYRSFYDNKTEDTSSCPNLGATYLRFDDVNENTAVDHVINSSVPPNNTNNGTVTGQLIQNGGIFYVKYSFSFNLKGFKTGFIDADIHSDLKATFRRGNNPTSSIKVSYKGKNGQETLVKEFDLTTASTTQSWTIPEMTWSEDFLNFLFVYVSDGETSVDKLELVRGYTGPDTPVNILSSDALVLQGYRSDFWWRRPLGESLTVKVRGQSFTDLSRLVVYVHAPWVGRRSFQQVFVVYQDGNVRLVPLPPTSPTADHWTPFGTSVIVGQSRPADLRPCASIKTLTFVPETLEMTLEYYDESTSKLALTYTVSETALKVTTTSGGGSLPFASFRSMFVRFGNTDSDSVESDTGGPKHVLGGWNRLSGREFLLFRAVESHHLTQSPDIRLTIQAQD